MPLGGLENQEETPPTTPMAGPHMFDNPNVLGRFDSRLVLLHLCLARY